MKAKNQDLITNLVKRTQEVLNQAQELLNQTEENLNKKKDAESWSALECIEHLNRYGDFYLPEVKRQITGAPAVNETTVFKAGLLGNYFAKGMLPKENLNKMKTFKVMNASGSVLDTEVLHKFIQQQHQWLDLLTSCRTVNMTKVKTAISISKFIKLRLGDTLRVVIYHNQRHLLQALRAVRN